MSGRLMTQGSPYRAVVAARLGTVAKHYWTLTLECGHVVRRRVTHHERKRGGPPIRARCIQCPEVPTTDGVVW